MKPEVLKKSLGVVSTLGGKLPVLLEVSAGRFYVGSAGESASILLEGATDLSDMSFTLPQEHVRQIIKALKPGIPLDLSETATGGLRVRQGKSTLIYSAVDSVVITRRLLTHYFTDKFSLEFDTEEFAKAIGRVSPFAGGSVVSKKVEGVHFSYSAGVVTLMATNSFSLATTVLNVKELDKAMEGTIILPKVIMSVPRTLGTSFKMGLNSKRMILLGEDDDLTYKVTLPTVEETPLPYEQLVSQVREDTTADEILLDRSELLEALRSSMYFTDEDVKYRIQMQYKDDELTLTSTDLQKGEAQCVVETIRMVGDGEMLMSADFLQKGVSIFTGELNLKVSQKFKRILIQDGETSVIVPSMRK